ncbi:MAG: hypothetical protein ACI8W8_002843 [Rhodothermales bacterium]
MESWRLNKAFAVRPARAANTIRLRDECRATGLVLPLAIHSNPPGNLGVLEVLSEMNFINYEIRGWHLAQAAEGQTSDGPV